MSLRKADSSHPLQHQNPSRQTFAITSGGAIGFSPAIEDRLSSLRILASHAGTMQTAGKMSAAERNAKAVISEPEHFSDDDRSALSCIVSGLLFNR